MKKIIINQLNFQKMGGVIPAIIQDVETKAVLMLGFMNKEALQKTIKSNKVTFWSRSKQKLWEKGETSGNILKVTAISADCDNDTVLIAAKPYGPTCHTGKYSCFELETEEGIGFLRQLYDLLVERKKELPKNSYTASLFKQGLTKILEKVEEESGEVLQAAKKETRTRIIEESADLLYHLLVLLVEKNISLDDLLKELKRRRK